MDEIKPEARTALSPLEASERERDGHEPETPEKKVRIFLVDKPNAEQSLIVAGNKISRARELDQIAVEVMNAVIGGTFTSRINMNLREEKHWSYGARSFIYETTGPQLFAAYANVQTDKTSESMTEIHRELTAFVGDEPVTDDELVKIQQNKTRKLPGQNETSAELLGSVSEIVEYGLPDDYYDQYSTAIQALDTDEVHAAAKQTIKLDEMTWIVIGDLDRIEDKVRALELGEITVVEDRGALVD